MILHNTPIDGVLLIELTLLRDHRGFFTERFSKADFAEAGLPTEFVQDNHSRSVPGVLRGVHYQHSPPQGKLVGVIRGRIWDVAVDLRPESATFGKSFGCELSDENGLSLWMPAGIGHGFAVIGEGDADVLYRATAEYDATGEGGISWDDPDLAIDWPVTDPKLSERDTHLPSFAEYRNAPPDWNLS